MGLITPRAIIDILFHHMVYLLTIHHPWLYRCLLRTLLILYLVVLRNIQLNPIRLKPITLMPGRRHKKLPQTIP